MGDKLVKIGVVLSLCANGVLGWFVWDGHREHQKTIEWADNVDEWRRFTGITTRRLGRRVQELREKHGALTTAEVDALIDSAFP